MREDFVPDEETLVWLSEKYEYFAETEENRKTALVFRQISAIARAEALHVREHEFSDEGNEETGHEA